MSFAGFYQCLCEKGHSLYFDVYETTEPFEEICHCGSPVSWYTLVDQTNCCDILVSEKDPKTCPMSDNGKCCGVGVGYVELEIEKTFEEEVCPNCKRSQITEQTTYKTPPKDVGHHREDYINPSPPDSDS